MVGRLAGLLMIVLFLSTACAQASGAATQPAANVLEARLSGLRQKLPQLKQSIDGLKGDPTYPLVTYTVLENFCELVQQDLDGGVPDAWGWVALNGNNSGYTVDRDDPHSPPCAIKIFNKTPLAPNVYGMMENSHGVSLTPGKPYTLSAWVRAIDAGRAGFTLNHDWTDRLAIPQSTGGKWERISKTFTPGPADAGFTPRITTESPTEGLWIDDVCLVAGDQPEVGTNLIYNGSFSELYTQHRAQHELDAIERMAARLQTQLQDAAAGKRSFPEVPRWIGTSRPKIIGPSFVGPVQWPSKPNQTVDRPIFFVGYGHFDQVRKDVDIFPNYGINIIQSAEFGPSAIYPTPTSTDDAMIRQTLAMLDRAQRAGVAVDLLISPHYFPQWMIDKYPQMRKRRADFFPYSVYSPQAQVLLKNFIAHTLAPMKDHPALLSICLSNEPINIEEPSDESTAAWHAWLTKKHRDIATLNKRWGSNYANFDAVPQPNPFGPAAGEKRPSPVWADYLRFNNEWFSNFHKMLADAVHEVAPNLPVHAKATTWTIYRPELAASGNEPTLLDAVTDIDGNDSVNVWGFGDRTSDSIERGGRDFAQGWRENAIGYDLQRSVRDAPVFNSENHLIMDRETGEIPPAHVRAALWHGAIHGQSATTIWVWERDNNPRSDFAGDIMERPQCAEAVGIVCDDLNRAAPEITAIQNEKPRVLILQSETAAAWDGHAYGDALIKAYTALSFTGLKIGFVTERQLEQGRPIGGELLIVPNITHLSDVAFDALAALKRPIIFIGSSALLGKNEYDAARGANLPVTRIDFAVGQTTWQQLWEQLQPQLAALQIAPLVQITGADGKPQNAVQWQCASDGGAIVNLYNSSHDPATIVIQSPGSSRGQYRDVLTGAAIVAGAKIKLDSLEVRLLRWQSR